MSPMPSRSHAFATALVVLAALATSAAPAAPAAPAIPDAGSDAASQSAPASHPPIWTEPYRGRSAGRCDIRKYRTLGWSMLESDPSPYRCDVIRVVADAGRAAPIRAVWPALTCAQGSTRSVCSVRTPVSDRRNARRLCTLSQQPYVREILCHMYLL